MCFRPPTASKPVKCPKCGVFNPPTATKCRKCGFSSQEGNSSSEADQKQPPK